MISTPLLTPVMASIDLSSPSNSIQTEKTTKQTDLDCRDAYLSSNENQHGRGHGTGLAMKSVSFRHLLSPPLSPFAAPVGPATSATSTNTKANAEAGKLDIPPTPPSVVTRPLQLVTGTMNGNMNGTSDPPIFSGPNSFFNDDLIPDSTASLFPPLADVARSKPASKPKQKQSVDSEYFDASFVFTLYGRNPRRWLALQRDALRVYANAKANSNSSSNLSSNQRSVRVSKQMLHGTGVGNGTGNLGGRATVSSPSMATRSTATPKSTMAKGTPKATPKARVSPTQFTMPLSALAGIGMNSNNTINANAGTTGSASSASSSPPTSPRTNVVHDLEYENLPDYCPPTSSLEGAKSMNTSWHGNAMDLSSDPDRHLLHPLEIQLASALRLPCAVYLDSKKRIFAERVFRARRGLPFRRTDSQKACRIDVNKATRLFVAFEKVGWLDDKWVSMFI
ncbi:uncharacterized protein V1516DRAFT_673798 [Lipomyces oligophaga]|uniref:uncharacterized protein n=1 Tax=Lipomyces oligophaga TaxID=45792 RepID=UPI0034CE956D